MGESVIHRHESHLIKYRGELMGIGAIGVLVTHASEFVNCPGLIEKAITYGGLGVYFFMFLSGVGLYYSMGKHGEKGIAVFLKRRITRVFIPYLLIAAVWYGIKYILLEHSVMMFLYELSTLSYWLEHKGAWYVAALVPIYALYPFYHLWLEKGHRGRKTAATIIIILCIEAFSYLYCHAFYEHLAQVMNSLWVFVLGNFFAERIKQKGTNMEGYLLVFVIAFVAEKILPLGKFLPIGGIMYAMKGILMLIVCAWVVHFAHVNVVHVILKWFGKHSLMLYLTNIFVIQAVKYFGFWDKKGSSIILYSIILSLGIVFTILFDRLADWIVRHLSFGGKLNT